MQTLAFRPPLLLAALIVLLLVPASAAGQVSTPPAGIGSVTFAWQWIDNTGHILTNGAPNDYGQSVTTSLLAEVDYGVTDRFAATVAIPFMFAKYTGKRPPFSGLERDDCQCWHQSFQDFSFGSRYRFGRLNGDSWTLTPQVRVVMPSHDYPAKGEAVVGPNLNQVLLGISGSWPLLSKASVHAGYTFALVEKVSTGQRPNRSSLFTSIGYAVTSSLYVHAGALSLNTHDGLTFEEVSRVPEADRAALSESLLKMRYVHLTAGLSYKVGFTDLFFSVQPYVWGRDTHDGIAYTVGSTWYFDWSR